MNVNVASTRVLIIAGVATFVAVIWWATRGKEDPAPVVPVPTAVQARTPGNFEAAAPVAKPAEPAGAAPQDDADAVASETSFRGFVSNKYRFLFRNTTLKPEAKAALEAALVERERVAMLIRTARQSPYEADRETIPQQQAQLVDRERKVAALLPAGGITSFEILKDSDTEQFQLEDYAGGISNVAPVNEDDKQAILMTKLTYQTRYRRVLDQSGLLRGELTRQERKLAFAEVSRALKSARDGYLQEVRQYLYNDEQYQLLSNYENTEYATELEKLRKVAEGE